MHHLNCKTERGLRNGWEPLFWAAFDRVVGLSARHQGYVVELEDCHLLDVVRVQATELRERGLRVVTPTPIDARDPSNTDAVEPVATVI